MATGNSTYMGLAVPLFGEFLVTQTTGATDIMTIEGGDGQTGDFIVARTSAGTERFIVEDGGNVAIVQGAAGDVGIKITQASTPTTHALQIVSNDGSTNRFAITKNHGLLLRSRTTRPTTGLTKGELMVIFHNDYPHIAVCANATSQLLRLVRVMNTTFGRATW